MNLSSHERAAVKAAIVRVIAADPHALAYALDVTPDAARSMVQLVLSDPKRKLSSVEAAALRLEFHSRSPDVTSRQWFAERAAALDCGESTLRKAVYGF